MKKYLRTMQILVVSMTYGMPLAQSLFLPEPTLLRNYHAICVDAEIETNNSFIHYIRGGEDNAYLFKQKKAMYHDKMVLYSVRDMFASIIAHSLDIPSNYVWFVPATIPFPGKKIQNSPATLHTLVPGIVVASIKKLSPRLKLKQWSAKKNPTAAGLTQLVIRSMTEHPDLPRLVALDTLVSNADRHNRNILYDESQDKFYGIDMDSTFRLESEIVTRSCENVIMMINDPKVTFSRKEIRSLRIYKRTLESFFQTFSLRELHALVDECFVKTGYIITKGTKDTNVALMHAVINVNYTETKRLIQLLDRLLATKKNRAVEV